MALEKREVHTYKVDFKCDVCGKGWQRPTGEIITTFPPIFPHKCNFCGAVMEVSEHTYPYTTVEEEEI